MSAIQFVVTAILVVTLLLFMTGSLTTFEISRFDPMFPNGFLTTLFMVSYIFPTYAGYETITQLSEEVKDGWEDDSKGSLSHVGSHNDTFYGLSSGSGRGGPD